MNCATSSASAPAITSTCPPTDTDCSSSEGPRPCWPSCKPHDPGLASSQLRRYLLARALTEPQDLTLFHPSTGRVRLQSATRCTNAILHPWLRERLSEASA